MNLKKIGALVMAGAMAITSVFAFSSTADAAVKKPEKVNITGNLGFTTEDAVGLNFTWDKVKGAKGYQVRYKVSAESDKNFTTKSTKKTAFKLSFQDHGDVYFQVRAYKNAKVNKKTKKVYGKWATAKFSSAEVE